MDSLDPSCDDVRLTRPAVWVRAHARKSGACHQAGLVMRGGLGSASLKAGTNYSPGDEAGPVPVVLHY